MKTLLIRGLLIIGVFIIPANLYSYSLNPYFDDVPDTHWAFEYVQRLFEAGITTGCDATHYCPGDNVSRAQMAAFIMRNIDYMIDYEIMPAVLADDGSGSGLDADLLDGQHASSFAASSHLHSGTDITTGTVADARIVSTIARDSEVTTQVNIHANRVDNPHSVTAAQVGASLSSHNHDSSYVNTTGDTMTGILNIPSNGFTVGTNQLVVSGDKVGIGTASPNEMLEITKAFNGFTGLRIDNPSAGANTEAGIDFYIGNKRGKIGVERTTLDLVIENSNTQTGANIMFNTSGSTPGTRMTITGDGKAGIGTIGPLAKLHIEDTNKDVGHYQNLYIQTSDEFGADKGGSIGFGGIYNSAGDHVPFAGITGKKENSNDGNWYAYLAFSTRRVTMQERVRITSTGNVGIGTASPQSKLQVEGYVQLALTSGSPNIADCNEASERGRMKVDNSAGLLYICVDSGWVAK